MSLGFLRSGPPPPKVALMSDGLFFVRAIEVDPGATAPAVGAQVELALEALAPFPLAQLYYGYFWMPGSNRALVFAAYRRRFTAEQLDVWEEADLVIPAFAALLGGSVGPATTLVLAASEGLTAIHWDSGAVPAQVLFLPLATPMPGAHEAHPEAAEEARVRARDELLRSLPSKTIIDLVAPPAAESVLSDRETVFHCGDFVSRLSREAVDALDMRDKAELALRRRGRARAILSWKVLVGCFIAAGAMALGEIALLGGGLWQQSLLTRLHAQAPVVEEIITAQSLATRIGELSTRRLLPLEMITAIVGSHNEIKPASILLTRVAMNSQLDLTVDAQTSNTGDINVYQNALTALPIISTVKVTNQRFQNNMTTFTLLIVFKPGLLKPMPLPS